MGMHLVARLYQRCAVASILVWVLLAANAHSQSQSQIQISGPSFPCPAPRDPLAQLICNSPNLWRIDLAFVQTYQALRQQLADPASQQALRQESLSFGLSVRTACGIGMAQSATSKIVPPPAPPGADSCIIQEYERQRGFWRNRLSGSAAEEAARPIEQQIILQVALQQIDLLPNTDSPDGIFGSATRTAIVTWQLAAGRTPTGLLGDADARALLQAGSTALVTGRDHDHAPVSEASAGTTAQKEARLSELKKKFGSHADAIVAGDVTIGMTAEEVLEARGRPQRQDSFPPNYRLWVYDSCRIAYTDGKVTHVGH